LIQRKVFANRGESLGVFIQEMRDWMQKITAPTLAGFVAMQSRYLDTLEALTQRLIVKGEASPQELGAAACDYLHVVGYITYGYLWLRMMHTAQAKQDSHAATKQKTGAYYFQRILPRVDSLIASIDAGSVAMMAFGSDEF